MSRFSSFRTARHVRKQNQDDAYETQESNIPKQTKVDFGTNETKQAKHHPLGSVPNKYLLAYSSFSSLISVIEKDGLKVRTNDLLRELQLVFQRHNVDADGRGYRTNGIPLYADARFNEHRMNDNDQFDLTVRPALQMLGGRRTSQNDFIARPSEHIVDELIAVMNCMSLNVTQPIYKNYWKDLWYMIDKLRGRYRKARASAGFVALFAVLLALPSSVEVDSVTSVKLITSIIREGLLEAKEYLVFNHHNIASLAYLALTKSGSDTGLEQLAKMLLCVWRPAVFYNQQHDYPSHVERIFQVASVASISKLITSKYDLGFPDNPTLEEIFNNCLRLELGCFDCEMLHPIAEALACILESEPHSIAKSLIWKFITDAMQTMKHTHPWQVASFLNLALVSHSQEPGSRFADLIATITTWLKADFRDKNAWTLMHFAANKKWYRILPIARQLGIQVNEVDIQDKQPIHIAVLDQANRRKADYPRRDVSAYTVKTIKKLIALGAIVDTPDKDGRTALVMASMSYVSTEVATTLVEFGADINQKDTNGRTALLESIKHHCTDTAKILIKAGANIHEQDMNGRTALLEAAEAGSTEVLAILIVAGADIHKQDNSGRTALHEAAKLSHSETVIQLLKLGADINRKDNMGCTALLEAAKHLYSKEIVALLLDAQADVNMKDHRGRTALLEAARHDDREMMTLLIQAGANINQQDVMGRTALLEAAKMNRDEETIVSLIKAGADVNLQDSNGRTALLEASIGFYSQKLVAILLDASANVNMEDYRGRTALLEAAEQNNVAMVALLIQAGANVNQQDNMGRTALLEAAKHFYSKGIVALLLDARTDVNMRDHEGRTALLEAAKHGDTETISLLIEAGAEVNKQANNGRSALHEVLEQVHPEGMVEVLLYAQADVNQEDNEGRTALIAAAERCFEHRVLAGLIQKGAKINKQDKGGQTALLTSMKLGNPVVVKKLIDEGADVNKQNNDGQTALLIAVAWGKAITTLLSAKADANKEDYQGRTPLIEAAKCDRNEETIAALIEAKAEINKQDVKGRTALLEAAKHSSQHVVTKLINGGADLKQRDNNGRTLLHEAAGNRDLKDLVEGFIREGLDINATDVLGRSPLHELLIHEATLVWTLLCGLHDFLPMPKAAMNLQANFLDKQKLGGRILDFLDNGADPNLSDSSGRTALHYAAWSFSPVATKALLSVGALINAVDREGQTPLHEAVKRGSYLVAQILINHGADLKLQDYSGQAPLDLMALRGHSRLWSLIEDSKPSGNESVQDLYDWAVKRNMEDGLNMGSDQCKYTQPSEGQSLSSGYDEFDSRNNLQVMTSMVAGKEDFKSYSWDLSNIPPGWLIMDWEVPALIMEMIDQVSTSEKRTAARFTALAQINAIGDVVVVAGSGDKYETATCKEFLQGHWGNTGLEVLVLLKKTLIKLTKPIAFNTIFGNTFARASHSNLMLFFGKSAKEEDKKEEQARMIEALKWFCQSMRPLPSREATEIFVSRTRDLVQPSSWQLHAYSLEPLQNIDVESMDRSTCWLNIFAGAIVADFPISRVWGQGLEMSFDMMVQLAGVENYFLVTNQTSGIVNSHKSGYVLVGFLTALIPIEEKAGHGIQWHLKYTENGLLRIEDLTTSTDWLRIQQTDKFSKSRCFLGWCDSANICLGTETMPMTVQWTNLPQRSRTLHTDGYGLTGQIAGNAGPVQIGGQITQNTRYVNNRQRFTPADTYAKAITIASKQIALVFDATSKRGWLVPRLSLMLHLCHAHFNYFDQTSKRDPIPYAQPSTNGATAASDALRDKGDTVVQSYGNTDVDNLKLRNILVDINLNLSGSLATTENENQKKLLAPELMDMIVEPGNGALLTEVISKESMKAWGLLARLVDSVCICSNLGLAIQPAALNINCDCGILKDNKYYLAAHLRCLEAVLQRHGHELDDIQQSPLKISKGWEWRFNQYRSCQHRTPSSFWSNTEGFLQQLVHQKPSWLTKKYKAKNKAPDLEGAVVF